MTEHEPREAPAIEARPAPDRISPDWRRLEVTANRFGPLIKQGIETARINQTEISGGTARCIAHVLGRAYGRESALADYGRTGEGTSLSLRDEYLALYNDPQLHPAVKEWIDWLGTYLIHRESTGSSRRFMNDRQPPQLERVLVRTDILIDGHPHEVHLPASLDSEAIEAIAEDLRNLSINEDAALQAFLSLPDVNAATPLLMEAFHESYIGAYDFPEDAGRELSELDSLELAIHEATESRSLPDTVVQIDYSIIDDHVRQTYDLVEWKGHTYAFHK